MATTELNQRAATIRLLRLLEANANNQTREGDDLLIVHKGVQHRFASHLLQLCQSQGLVEIKGIAVLLRSEGKAFLRRALHPEAGYAAQHGPIGLKELEPSGPPVLENLGESPLTRLFLRRDAKGKSFISATALAAGERYRADFEKAGLQPRVSANWEASVASRGRGGGDSGISDFAMDARKRFDRALGLLGRDLSGVTTDVCCFLKGLETVERERGWPPRSAKLMLRTALDLLAVHYGIAGTQPSRAGMQHWGTADFRPGLGNRA